MSKLTKIANITVVTDNKALMGKIESIASRGKRLDKDIHQAGVSALWHAQQHGDVSLVRRLVEAMPKGSRVKALVVWMTDHSPLYVDEEDKEIHIMKGWKAEDFALPDAAANPFWAYTQEKEPKPVTLEAVRKMLEKRLKTGVKQQHVSPEAVALIMAGFDAAEAVNDEAVIADFDAAKAVNG